MTHDASSPWQHDATYTYGHSGVVVSVHQERSAEREAAFFLPHLAAGMSILDVGCGPGSITLGLAERVAPGQVVGVDFERAVLEQARTLAAERGAPHVQFAVANAYHLPFPGETFDAVFAHTLLEHLPDPAAALREVWRVLKPRGLVGARDCDWASSVFWPPDALVAEAVELYARLWAHNGGDPNCGRRLGDLLRGMGCSRVETSASFRWDGTLRSSQSFGRLLADRFSLPNMVEPLVQLGWADMRTVERMRAACLRWSQRPDAFAATIMVEAVGWRG